MVQFLRQLGTKLISRYCVYSRCPIIVKFNFSPKNDKKIAKQVGDIDCTLLLKNKIKSLSDPSFYYFGPKGTFKTKPRGVENVI